MLKKKNQKKVNQKKVQNQSKPKKTLTAKKAPRNKKPSFDLILTSLSLRELRKIIPAREKIVHIDIIKIILENFGEECELNDIRYWILNQIIIKKIEAFRASKILKVWITLTNPDKSSIKSFKELMRDNKISPVTVEIYKP